MFRIKVMAFSHKKIQLLQKSGSQYDRCMGRKNYIVVPSHDTATCETVYCRVELLLHPLKMCTYPALLLLHLRILIIGCSSKFLLHIKLSFALTTTFSEYSYSCRRISRKVAHDLYNTLVPPESIHCKNWRCICKLFTFECIL